MKALLLSFLTLSLVTLSASAARQGELPLEHPDQILKKAYPGDANTKLIKFDEIESEKVKNALQDVDLPFEKGDGYYDSISSALYAVYTSSQQLAGYMYVNLLSYSEDPDLYLVAALINTRGRRLGGIHELNIYNDHDDEELKKLPAELQPKPEQD